ncbi:hypothetical protein ACX9NE_05555 [Mycobacterium sp. ML4]
MASEATTWSRTAEDVRDRLFCGRLSKTCDANLFWRRNKNVAAADSIGNRPRGALTSQDPAAMIVVAVTEMAF